MEVKKYTLDDVRKVMLEAHKGRFRMDGKTPYSAHPDAARDYALRLFGSTRLFVHNLSFQAAIILHDVPEDHSDEGYDLNFVRDHFGQEVFDFVFWVTKPPLPPEVEALRGAERDQAKLKINAEKYKTLADYGPPESHIIKICDRMDNLSDPEAWNDRFRKRYVKDTQNLIKAFWKVPEIVIVVDRLRKITGQSVT